MSLNKTLEYAVLVTSLLTTYCYGVTMELGGMMGLVLR